MLKKLALLILCFVCAFTAHGQRKKLELLGADELEGVMYKNQKANRLKGNVKMKFEGSLMRCNIGYMFMKSNNFDAFGNVSIKREDGMTIYGDSLFFNGDTKIAKIRGNVRVIDKKMTLRTNQLDYNMQNKTAWYYGGGDIVDDGTRLTSETGYLDSKQDFYSFKGDVVVNQKGSRIEADTLKYASGSKKAYFYGPTNIYTEGKVLYAESGIYNTQEDKAWFSENAWVETSTYKLYGDSLFFDSKNDYGYAVNNVKIESFKDSVTIYGDMAINDGAKNSSKIFGNALLMDRSGSDTTFINADTLISIQDTVKKENKIFAYKNVKIIKGGLKGVCDSMIYDGIDSTISFYESPILWNGQNQITGDSIIIIMKNNEVDKMHIHQKAFIVSQNERDTSRYDQVKGRYMLAYFKDSDLYQLDVDGNGESVYYAFDEKKVLMGLNKVICSNMKMFVVDGDMNNIRFYDRPIASFIPPQLITEDQRKLANFRWYTDERPTREGLMGEISQRTTINNVSEKVTSQETEAASSIKEEDKKDKKSERKERRRRKRK